MVPQADGPGRWGFRADSCIPFFMGKIMNSNKPCRRLARAVLLAGVVAVSGLVGCDSTPPAANEPSPPPPTDTGGLNKKGKVTQIPGKGRPAPGPMKTDNKTKPAS